MYTDLKGHCSVHRSRGALQCTQISRATAVYTDETGFVLVRCALIYMALAPITGIYPHHGRGSTRCTMICIVRCAMICIVRCTMICIVRCTMSYIARCTMICIVRRTMICIARCTIIYDVRCTMILGVEVDHTIYILYRHVLHFLI